MQFRLEADLLERLAAIELPALDHVPNLLDWLIRMGRSADISLRIGPVTDDNLVDQIFQPSASRSDHRDERHSLTEALFHEFVEKPLVRYRRVEDAIASERHEATRRCP
jgi:hypothetical protein